MANAWHDIYSHTFDSVDGNTFTWEIQKFTDPDPGLQATLTPAGRSFINTRWGVSGDDEFSGMMPSETTLTFYDTASSQVMTEIVSNLQADAENLRLVIKDGTVIKWTGFLDVGSISVRADDPQYTISLRAHCGLGKLKDSIYVASTDPYVLKEGRVTVTALIAELLAYTGSTLDFLIATNRYPYNGTTELVATDNPLDNIYVERRVFREKAEKEDGADNPISVADVLNAVCTRFGLRVTQAFGYWFLVNVDAFYTYGAATRYWRYDYTGAFVLTTNTDSTVSVPADISRSPATLSLLPPVNAARVNYLHGQIEFVRNPTFDYPREKWWEINNPVAEWSTSGLTTFIQVEADDWGFRIPTLQDYAWDNTLPNEFTNQGTGTGSWDKAIQDAITAVSSGIVYQDVGEVPAGTSLLINASCRPLADVNTTFIDSYATLNKMRATAQVKLDCGVNGTYYLTRIGTWATTTVWMPFPVGPGWNEILFNEQGTPVTPFAGTLTISLGPLFEEAWLTVDGGYNYVAPYLVWDNCSIVPVLPDGTYNPASTSTINYLAGGRDKPRVKEIDVYIGDGPSAHNDSRLTWDSAGTQLTTTWKEGVITGGDPGDTHDELQSRILLRAMNKVRQKFSETYADVGADMANPIYAIDRGGSNYVPMQLTVNWEDNSYSGTFYQALQNGFTDDLETGIFASKGSAIGSLGSSGNTGFAITELQHTFLSDMSKRITYTTAEIAPGSGASTISVSAIAEPLLHDGDLIVIVSPDLSFEIVEIGADQQPGATSLTIVDPTDHVSNYDFPNRIGYPASIFYTEDQLLTLARLGEAGWAVTVLAQEVATVDGNQPTVTDTLSVRDLNVDLKPGHWLMLDDGTEFQMDVADGYTNATAGPVNLSIETTSFACTDGQKIYSKGQVLRTEWLVTDGKIQGMIEREGARVAVVNEPLGASSTTINVFGPSGSGTTTVDMFKGDAVYIHSIVDGTVQKRYLANNELTGSSAFVFTATVTVNDGDYIFPSELAGFRLDASGMVFKNTHVYSSNFNGTVDDDGNITAAGTTGWCISSTGNAVFSGVTIRGNLSVNDIIGRLTINGGDVYAIDGSSNETTLDAGGLVTLSSGGLFSATIGSDGKIILFQDAGADAYYVYAQGGQINMRQYISATLTDQSFIKPDGLEGGTGASYVQKWSIDNTSGDASFATVQATDVQATDLQASNRLLLEGSTSGVTQVFSAAVGGQIITLPSSTGTLQLQDALLDDIAALTDPNFDKWLIWDDSAGALAWSSAMELDNAPSSSAWNGTTSTFTANSTLAFGDLCYMNSSGEMALADADAASTATSMLAVALGAITATTTGLFLVHGFVNSIGGVGAGTAGQVLYVHTTAGDATSTAPSGTGDIIRVIGYRSSAGGACYFNPSGSWAEVA